MTRAQRKTGLSLRAALMVFAVSGPVVFAIYAVITLLFLLAIIATLWLGLKLWIPDY